MSFIKVGQTWFNLLTITRVQVIEHSKPPSTQLAVSLTDRQQPVDVTDAGDVAKVLAFCERNSVGDSQAGQEKKQTNKQAA